MKLATVDLILIGLFALLAALMAVIVFATRVEFRCAALIFMVIGYPCILGILVQFDQRLR